MKFLKNQTKYTVFSFVIAALFVFSAVLLSGNIILPFLIFLLFALVMLYIVPFKMQKSVHMRANMILNTFCDPEEFISMTKEIRDEIYKNKNKKTTAVLNLNIASALLDAGKIQEAYKLLHQIDRKTFDTPDSSVLPVYYRNLAIANVMLKKIDEAEKWHQKCEALLKNHDPRTPLYKHIQLNLEASKNHIAFQKKDYVACKPYFEEILQKSSLSTNRDKLNAAYPLAVIYEKEGDMDRVKSLYRFLGFHGKNMHIGKVAAQRIKQEHWETENAPVSS